MKALIVAYWGGFIIPNASYDIRTLQNKGYIVESAANFLADNTEAYRQTLERMQVKTYQVGFPRSVNPFGIISALIELSHIIKNGKYDLVHCHTPIAAVCTRIACMGQSRNGLKVIYTAHGFHFYKGAPVLNWLAYFPIEWICSFFTDALITINKEDYMRANKKLHAKRTFYLPGMGVDTELFEKIEIDKGAKRKKIGIPENAILLFSVGELNKNKNHQVIIRAMAKLNNPNIHYVIAGQGQLCAYLEKLAKDLGIGEQLHLLGFRHDIGELCKAADIFCFPSLREGLGIAALEAMACGLPIITSNVHGINDYSFNGMTGYKVRPDDIAGFAKAIATLATERGKREALGGHNIEMVKKFDIHHAVRVKNEIYVRVSA